MKLIRIIQLYALSLLLVGGLMISCTAEASKPHNGGVCNGHDNCDTTNVDESITIEADSSAEGGDASADANANADADANANAEGGNVVINSKRPGNSYIGGGNSSAEDQKVFAIGGGWLTGNASIRLDLTDKDARTLRVAQEWKDAGYIDAANKLQCSIKLIHKPFGSAEECEAALAQPPAEVPMGYTIISEEDYDMLLMAQVSQEEFEEQQALAADRFAQQQSLIKSLEDENNEDDAAIAQLKREAAALRKAEEEQAAKRAAVRARLAPKTEEKEDGPESLN